MAIDKEQVKHLLGTGLPNDVVANAVGCFPGYITELMSDEAFKTDVINLRMVTLTAHNKRDSSVDALEDTLIAKTTEAVENGSIYKPMEIARLMSVVNNMKRRGVPAHESLSIQQTVVNLTMPTQVIREFVTNVTGEVIEVDTVEGKQVLTTMPASQLLSKLAKEAKNGSDGEKYRDLQRFLPPVSGGELIVDAVESRGRESIATSDRAQRDNLRKSFSIPA